MVYITSYYLNTLISEILRETIDLYRQSKCTLYFDGDYNVADEEIRDFIFSAPYFSGDPKSFLNAKENLSFIEVSKDWFNKFLENTYLWVESQEWLFYDVKYICDPSLNKSDDRKELDLSPYSKALFCCKRIF